MKPTQPNRPSLRRDSSCASHEEKWCECVGVTLPPISNDAHKYSRGSLLVLAGSRRYCGAGILAVLAAEKAGAGYVSLATPVDAAVAARQHLLCSPVIEALQDKEQGSFAATALPALLSDLRHVDALCLGPGLTLGEPVNAFVETVLTYAANKDLPLLLDADALGTLASDITLVEERVALAKAGAPQHYHLILTPHQGELERLYRAFLGSYQQKGVSVDHTAGMETRVAVMARTLARHLDAVVVAKGPTTYLAAGDELFMGNEATPALAKAGTGDVLAGIISSLLAQDIPARDAAVLGVRIHSAAGVHAEREQGRRSVTALDVVAALPKAVAQFETPVSSCGCSA